MDGITPAQQTAIEAQNPTTLCLATAGSGKTTVLVNRLQRYTEPTLVLTFSNAATDEIRKRLGESRHTVENLHKFCLRLIRKYHTLIGYRENVGVFPDHLIDETLKGIADRLRIKMSLKGIKERRKGSEIVWNEFRQEIRLDNLVDLDGILDAGLKILRHPDCRLPYKALCVDEIQDSGEQDWRIYRHLNKTLPMFGVGDMDQAIFEFRGARPDIFVRECQKSNSTLLTLEDSFRCSAEVCRLADRLMTHDPERIPKTIRPFRDEAGSHTVIHFHTDTQESAAVTTQALQIASQGRTVAVLCRTNAAVKRFHALTRTTESQSPTGWRQALAAIGLWINPNSTTLAKQLIDASGTDIKSAEIRARETGQSLLSVAQERKLVPVITSEPSLAGVPEYLSRWSIPREAAAEMQERAARAGSFEGFATDIHTATFVTEEPGESVQCMTIHRAKGLEWDVVFLPSFEAITRKDYDAASERRLVFVGVTRARSEVHFSWHAKRRTEFGPVECRPSPFLNEMGVRDGA